MSPLNKATLIGNLGKDPEVRYTQSGQSVATYSLATSETWKDQSGQKQERTEWHNIVAWGKLADLSQRFLTKGRQVYIEGRIQSRDWTDQSGNKRRTTEIIATNIVLLGNRNSQEGDYGAPPPYGATTQPMPSPASSYGGGKSQDASSSYSSSAEPEQPFGDAGITDSDIPF